MPTEYPKAVKRQLRELAGLAYERELARELGKLDEQFAVWKRGEINAFELSELIHEFHQKPARELFSRYTEGNMQDLLVAGAVANGILKREDISDEVWSCIASRVAFMRGEDES